ncbi:MAG: hypothetical protein M0R06_06295, partial [Sphaerochaeta sp.]|nr:hypothetical protein [Sphaerochaeta sp.]
MSQIYFKFLTDEGRGPFSGWNWSQYYPMGGEPGYWTPPVKRLNPCREGYHLCYADTLFRGYESSRLYKAWAGGQVILDIDKAVCERAQLLSRVVSWEP